MKADSKKIGGIMNRVALASILMTSLSLGSGAAAQTTIDFTNANAYGLNATTVMVENLRVDVATTNPNDPSRPNITSSYYNIPWRFNPGTLSLDPELETAVAVTAENSCATLQVYVTNSFTGDPLANAQVAVGSVYGSTDATGLATFTGLVMGSAHIQSTAVGFIQNERLVNLTCNMGSSVGISLNPSSGVGSLAADQVRVILSWGENPRDLDSHLTGPNENSNGSSTDTLNRMHVYWANRSTDVASLDVDDTSSYGPETMTVQPPTQGGKLRPGLYRYSVYQYAGTGTISTSSASITLQYGNVSRNYLPPAGGQGSGDLWTVFEFYVSPAGIVTVYDVNVIDTSYSGSSNGVPLRYLPYGELETGFDPTSLPEK